MTKAKFEVVKVQMIYGKTLTVLILTLANTRLTNKLIPTSNEGITSNENGTTDKIELGGTEDDIDVILNIGINSCNVIGKFNKAFSSVVFCSYGGNLITATSTFYVAFHCFFLGKRTHTRLVWGLKSVFFVVLCLARLFVFTISITI